jgi:hypothetical protein
MTLKNCHKKPSYCAVLYYSIAEWWHYAGTSDTYQMCHVAPATARIAHCTLQCHVVSACSVNPTENSSSNRAAKYSLAALRLSLGAIKGCAGGVSLRVRNMAIGSRVLATEETRSSSALYMC